MFTSSASLPFMVTVEPSAESPESNPCTHCRSASVVYIICKYNINMNRQHRDVVEPRGSLATAATHQVARRRDWKSHSPGGKAPVLQALRGKLPKSSLPALSHSLSLCLSLSLSLSLSLLTTMCIHANHGSGRHPDFEEPPGGLS